MLLTPEAVSFRISTTDLQAVYTESGGVNVRLDVQTLADYHHDTYREIELHFRPVAELRCTTLNFFEAHHNDFLIQPDVENVIACWQEKHLHPQSGFYQVMDSPLLQQKGRLYDPLQRLNLKHYLLVGYDSYIEIIATGYDMAGL
ncbi:Aminopeptidase N [Kosakonia sp. BK9b]|uniref:hypothetical protein n=1 Tax=Kosakonia sp. TaxID=1916651 RepID=UPI00289B7951|nr:hypothetical protein [Kosakonia sp.]